MALSDYRLEVSRLQSREEFRDGDEPNSGFGDKRGAIGKHWSVDRNERHDIVRPDQSFLEMDSRQEAGLGRRFD